MGRRTEDKNEGVGIEKIEDDTEVLAKVMFQLVALVLKTTNVYDNN